MSLTTFLQGATRCPNPGITTRWQVAYRNTAIPVALWQPLDDLLTTRGVRPRDLAFVWPTDAQPGDLLRLTARRLTAGRRVVEYALGEDEQTHALPAAERAFAAAITLPRRILQSWPRARQTVAEAWDTAARGEDLLRGVGSYLPRAQLVEVTCAGVETMLEALSRPTGRAPVLTRRTVAPLRATLDTARAWVQGRVPRDVVEEAVAATEARARRDRGWASNSGIWAVAWAAATVYTDEAPGTAAYALHTAAEAMNLANPGAHPTLAPRRLADLVRQHVRLRDVVRGLLAAPPPSARDEAPRTEAPAP